VNGAGVGKIKIVDNAEVCSDAIEKVDHGSAAFWNVNRNTKVDIRPDVIEVQSQQLD
jgi:hypothetical protein